MPIYEEKLISPLAVRYTQEHIKTVFRDAHVVQNTAEQITTEKCDGDYDLVLQEPFPLIEIVRWGAHAGMEGEHWFTLDNRRLYCLQYAAMKHWPLRVAAKVHILRADPQVVKRKYDSSTGGASVTAAHSCKEAPLFMWDWREEVAKPISHAVQTALDAVALDDNKEEVEELAGASHGPESSLARMEAHEKAMASAPPVRVPKPSETTRSSTPSTSAASEDSDHTPREEVWSFEEACGNWQHKPMMDMRRDSRAMQATQALLEITQQLRAPGSDGRLRVPNWSERYGKRLGSLRRFIEFRHEQFTVIPEREGKFRVREVMAESCADFSVEATEAAAAVIEIKRQLWAQGGSGNVRIDDWNGRYLQSLGPFKTFIRSRPDFEIVPSTSRFFKVAMVQSS